MTRFTYAEYISLFRTSDTKRNSSPRKASSSERDIEPTEPSEVICAVRRGDVQRVCELASGVCELASGVCELEADDWTPLHEAAHRGQTACVRALLKARGVCVDKRTLQEQTALMLAVQGRHLDCVRVLLEAGADPDISNKDKETPLYKACEQECVRVVKLLLASGAAVNQRCRRGWTALHEAARRNSIQLCQTLLQARAAIDARNADDVTPAIEAARLGRIEALAFLIQKGAGVNLQTCDGDTALTEACRHGHRETVKLLLEHHADANKASNANLLPLHIASQRGHEEIVSLLLPVSSRAQLRRSGISPLHLAAEHNRLNVLRLLIRSGCDVNSRLSAARSAAFQDGHASALFCAVAAGHTRAVAVLLEAGADPNIDPLSPLLLAAHQGCVESVDLLLEHGARLDTSPPGLKASFPAVLMYTHQLDVLRCLLEHGCDAQACFTRHTHHSRSEPEIQFCAWISSSCWSRSAAAVVDLLLDGVGNVRLCSRITDLLQDAPEWPSIRDKTLCRMLGVCE
ncbi:ankyrin repeat and SOCS box protein 2b isoform X2 [Pseudorasbora parva]|uniref:ankyrin repeat and SOCS box protein 2b isoform X2 n=1 Tax=Pseudorasbora parva TaxID=51549 RepID=UPI00351DECBB